MLSGKKILLGITGGIAAYKIPAFIRSVERAGGEIQCIATHAGMQFVTEQTLATLSRNPVWCELFARRDSIGHIELSRWGDVLVIAPATANTLAKMAHGIADNLLTTTVLSFKGPVLVAPAMNSAMWEKAVTQENMRILAKRGIAVAGPDSGSLACGETGAGRMVSPEILLQHVERLCSPGLLKGKKVLVTAGPTREHLDPVRFLSNGSTGKMGIAVAHAAWHMGADVSLVTGPTSQPVLPEIKTLRVTSAAEMLSAVKKEFPKCHLFVANAAVSDFMPSVTRKRKTAKQEVGASIAIKKAVDVLAWAGKNRRKQKIVGFALETHNEKANALAKMKKKGCDYIVANNPFADGGGMGGNCNACRLYGKGGKVISLPLANKAEIARQLLKAVSV